MLLRGLVLFMWKTEVVFCLPQPHGILYHLFKDSYNPFLHGQWNASLIHPRRTQKSSPVVPKWTLECLPTFDNLKEWAVSLFYVQALNSLLQRRQLPPVENVSSLAVRSCTLWNIILFWNLSQWLPIGESAVHRGDLMPALYFLPWCMHHQLGGRRQGQNGVIMLGQKVKRGWSRVWRNRHWEECKYWQRIKIRVYRQKWKRLEVEMRKTELGQRHHC